MGKVIYKPSILTIVSIITITTIVYDFFAAQTLTYCWLAELQASYTLCSSASTVQLEMGNAGVAIDKCEDVIAVSLSLAYSSGQLVVVVCVLCFM